MSTDLGTYLQKAQEAIEAVYRSEYHNSLGIPFPKVEMLLADDANYTTGLYFIRIDQTWQIHLNFGLLPKSYKAFQDEVKVLTRHEIEHYMCCPFDVLTHLRMLKTICDVYNKQFADLGIDINSICASIANQAADIIVDTKNFFNHPEETLRSEIDWIKKGADFKKCPKHSKLMFLTKEAIWGKSLGLNEVDEDVLSSAKNLANLFLQNGIDDKNSFLLKTEEYTRSFFELYKKDREENSKQSVSDNDPENQNGAPNNSSSHSTQNSQHTEDDGGASTSGDNAKPFNESNGARAKDGDKNGSAFVFADPDKIKEALVILANETKIDEFIQLLENAGIRGLSKKQKQNLWFSVHAAESIPIEEYSNKGSKGIYSYPSQWRIGDSVEDLDLMLSLMNSPFVIPGVTTKKWETITDETFAAEKKQQDLFLIVDTSGSMGTPIDEQSNMYQAVLAAYGIVAYFEQVNGKIALLGFNDRISAKVSWTNDYNCIRDSLLIDGHGGTNFPIKQVETVLEEKTNSIVTVLITDGELRNLSESITFFRQFLYGENKLYVFLLGKNRHQLNYTPLIELGAHIYQSETAAEFSGVVIGDLE